MTVLAPIVQTWDGTNRRIYLKQGVSDFYPIEDIYHEYRYARRTDETLRKFEPLLRAEGNIPKGGGAFTPRYVVLLDGTKIVPYDEGTRINQLGDMITDDPDTDPDLYDLSGFVNPIRVFIKPSEAEVIQLNSSAIQYSSYGNGVTIDMVNGVAGQVYPIGTPQLPSSNLTDAHAIATADGNGFGTFFIIGDLPIRATDPNVAGHNFIGNGRDRTVISIEDGAVVDDCAYYEAEVTGFLDGDSKLRDGRVTALSYVEGEVERCILSAVADIVLAGTGEANFIDCYSGKPGDGFPSVDMNGSGMALAFRNYSGSIGLKNKTGPEAVTIHLLGGKAHLFNTVVNGQLVFYGTGELLDENGDHIVSGSWNGCTIINDLIGQNVRELHQAHFNKRVWDKDGNTVTVFDTDGVTPLHVFDVNSDLSSVVPR